MDLLRKHEMFLETQARSAVQHLRRRQELATVSSKLSVEEDTSSQTAAIRLGMEGKGPRVVSKVVKNYRKKFKKKQKRKLDNLPESEKA